MGTTIDDLKRWFQEGVEQGATHMIVVCDTFDWEDFPVYVTPEEDVRKRVSEEGSKEMQRVMEVYNLKKSMADQFEAGTRVFNY